MKLAIMQPYIFPYIGYFQLISAVDKFVFYDDVNFIKQGWVNRNRILLNGKEHLFSLPMKKQSSFNNILDTYVNRQQYIVWKKKFYKTLEQAYKKAPYYDKVYPLISAVLESGNDSIAYIAKASIKITCRYLNIDKQWNDSSSSYKNEHLFAQERVIDICRKESASTYINPIGGVELYSDSEFKQHQIELKFLKSTMIHYRQFDDRFVPGLSIIDVMMFNPVERVKMFLTHYELV